MLCGSDGTQEYTILLDAMVSNKGGGEDALLRLLLVKKVSLFFVSGIDLKQT